MPDFLQTLIDLFYARDLYRRGRAGQGQSPAQVEELNQEPKLRQKLNPTVTCPACGDPLPPWDNKCARCGKRVRR